MYTEEEEFNYDDYLDENEKDSSKKTFFDVRFILKVILIILLVVLIIFLVFKIKNKNISSNNKDNKISVLDSTVVFNSNMEMIREAAHEYFFVKGNLPQKEGESLTVKVKTLMDENLIQRVIDEKGNSCGYNTSTATITKNKVDYKMEVRLSCPYKSDTLVYYYDIQGVCLTCKGENYDSVKANSEFKENNKVENNSSNNQNNNSNESDKVFEDDNKDNVPSNKVCNGNYSNWSTEYVAGNNLEYETRTLVRGYKEEVTYGEWGLATTLQQTSNDNLEVKTFVEIEPKSTTSCQETTTKPSSKAGRTITSRVETQKETTKSCTKDRTYTKTLTKWDNTAYKCKTLGIGKVECTYKVKGTCKNVTTTKKVTIYKYCDTKTTNIETTYYQSRPITKNLVYTDYILESEMPEGYQKLNGSERVEYRYREKCEK